jgi:hypothetical protein
MARKSRSSRRRRKAQPSAPPPTGRQRPRTAAAEARSEAADPSRAPTEPRQGAGSDDLGVTYAHVRRDLTRILVLAVVMFGIIFVSPFILQ